MTRAKAKLGVPHDLMACHTERLAVNSSFTAPNGATQ